MPATPPSTSRQRHFVQEPVSVRTFCRTYKLRQDMLPRLTGFSTRAVANWAQGQAPSPPAAKKLLELRRLFEALCRLVEAKAIGSWLMQPNPAFDGSTPLQVIERGESDRLWRMIYELESGQPD